MQCSRTILRLILEQCCYKDALAASNLHQIISHNTRGLKLSSNLLGPLFFYLGRVKLYFTVTSRVFITKTKIGSTCGLWYTLFKESTQFRINSHMIFAGVCSVYPYIHPFSKKNKNKNNMCFLLFTQKTQRIAKFKKTWKVMKRS